MGDTSLLEVKNLSVNFYTDFGVVPAVDEISFNIERSQSLGLVGESGSGKSVTARALINIVQPPGRIDSGEVWFHRADGSAPVDLLSLKPKGVQIRQYRGKRISMIFQDPMSCLSPVHTVGFQIEESIRLHYPRTSRSEARDRAAKLLDQVGIPDPVSRLKTYPFELSGGMLQRALIAVALAPEPDLLVADEPTTAIDVTIQAVCLELLKRLQVEHQMALLLITHDLGVVAEVCEQVAVMYLGNVVEIGPIDDIFDQPHHPYTRMLFRSIPTPEVPPKSKLVTMGSVPAPLSRPPGCPFSDRCPDFMAGQCDRAAPDLRAVKDHHQVACFLYDE